MKRIIRAFGAIALVHIAAAGTPEVTSPAPESRTKLYGWFEAGFTANSAQPNDHQNFGRLFDDRANEPLFNQAVITLERTLSSAPAGFDWGFKLQAMVGS